MAPGKATADTVCGVRVLRCDGVLGECLPHQPLRGLTGTSLLPGINRRYLVSCSDLSKQTLLHLQQKYDAVDGYRNFKGTLETTAAPGKFHY